MLLLSSALVGGPAAARPEARSPRTGTVSRPQHAVRWEVGLATDLGTLPGSTFSRAFAANDRGVVVGYGTRDGENRAFLLRLP